MDEQSIGWSMKEWMRCVSHRLEESGTEVIQDDDFKSLLKEVIMKYAAQLVPTQEESQLMSVAPVEEEETAPQYAYEGDEENVLARPKKSKSVRRPRKNKKKDQQPIERSPAPSQGDKDLEESSQSASESSEGGVDSGDEVLDVRDIISSKRRVLRRDAQPKEGQKMTYAEAVAEARQKVVSEEMEAVQSAERVLTEAELHRKELIEMDEEQREEMTERLRELALQGIKRQVVPMLRRARRQVRNVCHGADMT